MLFNHSRPYYKDSSQYLFALAKGHSYLAVLPVVKNKGLNKKGECHGYGN